MGYLQRKDFVVSCGMDWTEKLFVPAVLLIHLEWLNTLLNFSLVCFSFLLISGLGNLIIVWGEVVCSTF